jgi:hydroxylamine reductase
MFCYQCEQTAHGVGCAATGSCGKNPEISDLQDLLVHAVKLAARRLAGVPAAERPQEAAALIEDALFATVTNVNFDADRLTGLIGQVAALAGPDCGFIPANDPAGLSAQAESTGIVSRRARFGEDVAGLQDLLLFGVKGVAAYAYHARRLGRTDPAVDAFMVEALARLADHPTDVNELVGLNLKCGAITVAVLALLDEANTGGFGHPVPTPVRMGHVPGKAILVSGHDLADLKALLEQTEGTGVNVYTHGEMLPAHAYPELRKHAHLAGHFGGAWMWQRREFDQFPGPVLMTTNCIQRPADSYADRLYTCGPVAWPGVKHIDGHDFTALITAAREQPGFDDEAADAADHLVGFGHNAVLGAADAVIGAVKSGVIKKFVLIGGCDGADTARSYYGDLAEQAPQDWMILTLGCGKFRLLGKDYGTVGGLPRLLDMGQCNDAYSAVKVAMALADAFDCGVNDLPLNLVLSWYEQKAVCILLALLHLGVKNVRIGPSLPAFVSPAVLKVLVDTFNVMPVGSVESDLAALSSAA